jgi:DNA-binding MarR family transcriptional regulator
MSIQLADSRMGVIYDRLVRDSPAVSAYAITCSLKVLRLSHHFHFKLEKLFSKFDLNSQRFVLLMILRQSPQGLPPSEFANLAQVSRATGTQLIDFLERKELVRRSDHPRDRRSLLVQLTPKADGILKQVIPLHLKYLEEFVSKLKHNERKQLFSFLSRLALQTPLKNLNPGSK